MNEPPQESKAIAHPVHFSVDASVIFQLGEHLISDAVQALVELIKNSYDADATQVLVEVDTEWRGVGPGTADRVGRIIVSDDGSGMTMADLKRGWLTLSNSGKRQSKRAGETTVRGRTPLGEKGLGRLGAQRLGHDIELQTIPAHESKEFRLGYSWDAFATATSIDAVHFDIVERPSNSEHGTWITIFGLKSAETWTEKEARDRLEENLSQLVSPYAEVADFKVDVTIDGRSLELTRITASVLSAADLHYDLEYDSSGQAKFTGRARLAFFQPPSGEKLRQFHRIAAADGGDALFDHLLAKRKGDPFDLRRSAREGWFVEFEITARLADQKPRHFVPDPRSPLLSRVADPGPFLGAIDSFDLGESGSREQTAFDNKETFRAYVKRFSGVRVYRDGFGIRVDRDWLKLSESSTSGRSYYGLRPFNTLGFVAISARDNPELLEKTDREGFQFTPHYENFYKLLERFVKFSGDAQTELRRAYNSFAKAHLESEADVEPDSSPASLTERLTDALTAASQYRQPVAVYSREMKDGIDTLTQQLERVDARLGTGDAAKQIASLLAEVHAHVRQLQSTASRAEPSLISLDSYLASVSQLDPVGLLLTEQVADLEGRLGDLYEAASLGLTAEALSHEIAQITDQLQTRVARLERALKANKIKPNDDVQDFIAVVRGSVDGLRHQLSHLAPSLRYARDTKEVMGMGRFITELFKYHEERLSDTLLQLHVEVEQRGDFEVQMNRGKLTQVFDNLVLNSEYWLRRHPRRRGEATITASIAQPFVYLSDTGPGIERMYEGSLFQPFVTGKPKGEGRGLGLFIIEQLLAMDGCTIALVPERNGGGRLFKFELNFVGALHE